MKQRIAQLSGIIRYELLMQFRRRTLIVLGVFFLIGTVGLSTMIDSTREVLPRMQDVRIEGENIIITYLDTETNTTSENVYLQSELNLPVWYADVDILQLQSTWEALTIIAAGGMVLLIAIMPMLAEIIPLDRQYRVRELLKTTPLGISTYLGGKALSVTVGLLITLIICCIAFGIFSSLRFGALDVITYTRYWLIAVLPPALIAGGYSILIPAFAATRRSAVLVGIFIIPLGILLAVNTISVTYLNNPLFAPVRVGQMGLGYQDLLNLMFQDVLNVQLPYFGALILIAVVVWAGFRLREAH